MQQQDFKLMIIGYARSGKDHAGEYIASKLNLSFESSSMFACKRFIFDEIKDVFGYETPKQCFMDRHSSGMREIWYNLIADYNKDDPTRLCTELYKEHDIYVGLRSFKELEQVKDKFGEDLLVIWIDSEGRTYPESSSSCTVTKDMADIVIQNKTMVVDFEKKLSKLCKLLMPQFYF